VKHASRAAKTPGQRPHHICVGDHMTWNWPAYEIAPAPSDTVLSRRPFRSCAAGLEAQVGVRFSELTSGAEEAADRLLGPPAPSLKGRIEALRIPQCRKPIGLRACGRVLVRRCGRPRAVMARCRSQELSTFPGVENVALAPS
jgi:hypothetical protein